jgi:hypothetical protein
MEVHTVNRLTIFKSILPLLVLALSFMNCDMDNNPVNTFVKAVDRVPDFTPIPGGANVTLTINKNKSNSYFTVDLNNIGENPIISNGEYQAWCVLYDIPITAMGEEYNGVKLYSTEDDNKWKHIHYLLSRSYLYPMLFQGATWREIQVAIWALTDFRVFDLDNIDIRSLDSDFRSGDQLLFDISIVKMIVNDVQQNASSFDFEKHAGQVILMETPKGTQNLITYTPGGWGAPPRGNNPGQLLHRYFDAVYPNGFVVGSKYTITFTSAKKITDFLPITGGNRQDVLDKTYVNPNPGDLKSGKTLAQATIALKLNVDFNNAGKLGGTNPYLKDLYVIDPKSPCYGWTVGELLKAAEEVLGGNKSAKNPSITANQLYECADKINNNFSDGKDYGYLGLSKP